MKQQDYPPQEPLSEAGAAYGAECWQRSSGIAYKEFSYGPDVYQRLAVFPAWKPDGRVFLFWHGGGWTSGYKEWMGFMAPAFNDAGITFVSAGYRLAPGHLFPTGVEDCAASLKWVVENIHADGGNSAQIFIGGHSAGGHYAALLSVSRRWTAPIGLADDVVRGCLPLSGVFEFGEGSGLSVKPRFLGSDPTAERDASPIHQLGESIPPFLVAYGSKDFPHLVTQGNRFAAALRLHEVPTDEVLMDGLTHFTASFAGGETSGPWVPRALRFMEV